jgi:hypothetical protein
MSTINSVKFKDKKSFEKNKTKSNVLAVHEPFGIIVFKDDAPVLTDPTKVSQTSSVDGSLDQISTGLAILISHKYDEGLNYLKANNLVITDSFELSKTFFVEVPDFIPFDSFYGSIMATGLFISVEPDYIMPMEANAEMAYTGHWHLPNMKCQEAWSILPAGVVKEVAVLDIACETNHEDLAGTISSTSWNCVTDGPDVNPISEFEKHGTACSGVICANTGNDIGCKSISNNHLKVQFLHIGYNSSSTGGFQTSDTIITRAVNKAIANPNCVAMSMSWSSLGSGYPIFSNALTAARTTARNGKGIPLFASSGNSYQSDFVNIPAAYPSVMAVGASTSSDTRAAFSNYGPKLFAAAPGTSLYTVDRTGAAGYGAESYKGFSGTSASCPAMAAVAGCVLVKNPDLTEAQVRDILKNSCRKVGGYVYTNGKSAELGWGIIDMYAAVSVAGGTDPGDPTPPPTPAYNVYGVVSSQSTVEAGLPVNVSYSIIADKAMTAATTVPFTLSLKKSDGSSLNFYTGNITLQVGETTKTGMLPYTMPNNVSGVCQFVMAIDPNNVLQETNENDNIALTSINVTQPTPPTGSLDVEASLTRYEWLDANRVRIWYTVTNRGTTTVTSWKANVGFIGKSQLTWNRLETIQPGRSVSGGTVWTSTLYGNMPNTFKLEVTQLNGLPDTNPANNVATIYITK